MSPLIRAARALVRRLGWLALVATTACSSGDGPFVDGCALAGDIRVLDNPDNPLSAVARVVVDGDMQVWAEYGVDGAFDRATPAYQASIGAPTDVLLLGLHAATEYEIRAVARDGDSEWVSDKLTYTTPPLDEGWPRCVVSGEPEVFPADAVVCTNQQLDDETPLYVCVDREGQPVWTLRHPDDERMQVVRALSDGRWAGVGDSDSFVAVFDRYGARVGQWSDLWFESRTRFFHQWIDMHEVIEVTEGPWAGALLLITATVDQVHGEERGGAGFIVFDADAEEVLYDWHIHGELGDDTPIDPAMIDYERYGQHDEGGVRYWNHGNALLHGVDDDGGQYVWVSLRAQDWIIKVDVDTDEVLWRLGNEGDFALVDDLDAADPEPLDPRRWMFQQHAPEWQSRAGDRTRLLVYDNGVSRAGDHGDAPDPYSRIVELEIDEATMRATILFEYGAEDEADPTHFYSRQLGDADMLPGGDAILFNEGLGDPWAALVDYPAGVERWRYHCPDLPRFYRLNYFPDLYDTTWWYDVER